MNGEERLSEVFEKDHAEIDSILASVDLERPAQDLPRLSEFDERLERHIVWEEDVLFPAAARLLPPVVAGPIAVMREEHRLIRRLKREAMAALRAGDGRTAKLRIQQMQGVLGAHNTKEERFLYPMCDRVLAGEEASRIVAVVKSSRMAETLLTEGYDPARGSAETRE